MRIGIYVDSAKEKEARGVGYHVRNLVQGLASVDEDNEYILYYQCDLLARDSYRTMFPAQRNLHPRPVRFPAGWSENRPNVWLNQRLPWAIRRDRIDVFHCPNHFLPGISPIPTV